MTIGEGSVVGQNLAGNDGMWLSTDEKMNSMITTIFAKEVQFFKSLVISTEATINLPQRKLIPKTSLLGLLSW